MTTNFLEKHVSLYASNSIKEICKPLLDHVGVNYFSFHRVYEEGTVIRLSTYPEWTKRYIEQDYFKKVKLDQYSTCLAKKQYYLWSQYPMIDPSALLIMQDSYKNFGLYNGISLYNRQESYSDQYILAVLGNQKRVEEYSYLVLMDQIENFCTYFLEKASKLIIEAEKSKFQTNILDLNLTDVSLQKTKNSDDNLKVMVNSNIINLTKRERETLQGLLIGKTAKIIAQEHKISPRTVEVYINNLKFKAGVKTRTELTEAIIESKPLFQYLIRSL